MKDFLSIAKRIVVEFGLPVLIGIGWVAWEVGRKGPLTEYVKQFGVAFFMASWVWGQLLRIVYQQTQKERLKGLGEKLEAAAGTMKQLQSIANNILAKVTPATETDVRHLISTVRTANNQIESANSDYWEFGRDYAGRRKPGVLLVSKATIEKLLAERDGRADNRTGA